MPGVHIRLDNMCGKGFRTNVSLGVRPLDTVLKHMAEKANRTLGEQVNTWLQSIAILVAGVWAVYTFVYKEFTKPQIAPTHVSSQIDLMKGKDPMTVQFEKGSPVPIIASVSFTNGSSQTVFNLSGIIAVWGYNYTGRSSEAKEFELFATRILSEDPSKQIRIERHFFEQHSQLVALIPLSSPAWLQPGETTTNKYLFHVAKGAYDYLEALVIFPCAVKRDRTVLRWSVSSDDSTVEPLYYSVKSDGTRELISEGELEIWQKRMEGDIQLQMAVARTIMNL